MKLRIGSSNIALTIGTLFICLFTFVAPMLAFTNMGFNETTFMGFILVFVVGALMYHIYKTNLPKKNYELIFAFVLLPILTAVAGLFVLVFNKYSFLY